jgi:hypothetical protein
LNLKLRQVVYCLKQTIQEYSEYYLSEINYNNKKHGYQKQSKRVWELH